MVAIYESDLWNYRVYEKHFKLKRANCFFLGSRGNGLTFIKVSKRFSSISFWSLLFFSKGKPALVQSVIPFFCFLWKLRIRTFESQKGFYISEIQNWIKTLRSDILWKGNEYSDIFPLWCAESVWSGMKHPVPDFDNEFLKLFWLVTLYFLNKMARQAKRGCHLKWITDMENANPW